MSQSRQHSFIEAVTNVSVGYVLAIGTQYFAWWVYGLQSSLTEHLGIASLFIGVSLCRSYVLRRAFNKWHQYEAGIERRLGI